MPVPATLYSTGRSRAFWLSGSAVGIVLVALILTWVVARSVRNQAPVKAAKVDLTAAFRAVQGGDIQPARPLPDHDANGDLRSPDVLAQTPQTPQTEARSDGRAEAPKTAEGKPNDGEAPKLSLESSEGDAWIPQASVLKALGPRAPSLQQPIQQLPQAERLEMPVRPSPMPLTQQVPETIVAPEEPLRINPGPAEPPQVVNIVSAASDTREPDSRSAVDHEREVVPQQSAKVGQAVKTSDALHFTEEVVIDAGQGCLAVVAFVADGLRSTGDNGTEKIWQLGNWTCYSSAPKKSSKPGILRDREGRPCVRSEDGTQVASFEGRRITVSNNQGGQVFQLEVDRGNVSSVAFSPSGHYLAAGNSSAGIPPFAWKDVHRRIVVWDLATRTIIQELAATENKPRSVAFSADGRWLAACGTDGRIKIWRITPPLRPSSPLAYDLPRTN